MSDDRLKYVVDMANQIAVNLIHGKEQQQCVTDISHHINRFWAPSMRAHLQKRQTMITINSKLWLF
jgi:chemotaxis regulatin CheY-phosphate phosphatase CheZ